MHFIKSFLRNILLLLAIGAVLYFLFPDLMRQVFSLYGALFGPLAILIVAALPRRARR